MSNRAWVTLATNDSYGLGALVLAHSLRRSASAYPAVVLITPSVTEAMRDRLRAVFAEVVTVDVLDSRDAAHLALMQRPELGITFTKIHCWNLTQYEKCVFLDADVLVVQNCDELFEREELSAAPDVGWPDCFNSGVFVFTPSAETFNRLIAFAQERGSFDGGDQGLLNSFFSDWAHGDIKKHLPFLYNVTSAAFYSYLPALKHYGQNLKIIHFIGAAKPWLQHFNWESFSVDAPDHLREFLQLWWDFFVAHVHPRLDIAMVEVGEAPPAVSPPSQPPQDVSYHYQPVLDPESEFPWHHPHAQIQEETPERQIDFTELYDPWDIYKGHIPPKSDDMTHHPEFGRNDEQEELRNYAWEYQSQNYEQELNEQKTGYCEQPQRSEYNYYGSYDHHKHEEQSYQRHYEHSQQQWQQEYQHEPRHDYAQYEQSITDSQWQQQQYYQDNSNEQNLHQNFEQTPSHIINSHHSYCNTDFNNSQNQNETQYDYYDNYKQHYPHSKEQLQQNIQQLSVSDKNHDHEHRYREAAYFQTDITPTVPRSKQQEIEICHIQVEQGEKGPRPRRFSRTDFGITPEKMMNGDLSDTDNEDYEEVRPRHPYDGFYLRHRATIDSHGRKICTHEVPPTPTQSPSPPPELVPDVVNFPGDEGRPLSDSEDQTGVAGNLARVVPGAIGSQREALDELTRRQGWEAGNIDYMGADSFANIWAKISQTLSQPRTSPVKQSPPREPTPPQPAPEAVIQAAAVSEPVMESVEVAKEATEAPAPIEAPAPVEAPKPVKATAPVEASAPVEAPAPVKAAAAPIEPPAQVQTASEAPAPLEVAAPAVQACSRFEIQETIPLPLVMEPLVDPTVDVPVTVEVPVPAEPPESLAPAVAPATADVAATDIPVTVEAAEKAVSEAEAAVPVEAPITTESVTPVESVAAVEPAVIVPSDIPVPVEASAVVPLPVEAAAAKVPQKPKKTETPVAPAVAAAAAAESVVEAPKSTTPVQTTPPKGAASDSPPLAHTPSKEDVPVVPAAQSEERRKPAGKLTLSPPIAADPLPTPDSELEDAAALAHSIIASELQAAKAEPAIPPTPATAPADFDRLTIEGPEVPTPPVGAVSLAQIGVKPKGKPTTAAQIESSITKGDSAPTTPTEPPKETPKKKVVKKVVKKEGGSSAEAPVPPPRKKEKKPKEK